MDIIQAELWHPSFAVHCSLNFFMALEALYEICVRALLLCLFVVKSP